MIRVFYEMQDTIYVRTFTDNILNEFKQIRFYTKCNFMCISG